METEQKMHKKENFLFSAKCPGRSQGGDGGVPDCDLP